MHAQLQKASIEIIYILIKQLIRTIKRKKKKTSNRQREARLSQRNIENVHCHAIPNEILPIKCMDPNRVIDTTETDRVKVVSLRADTPTQP